MALTEVEKVLGSVAAQLMNGEEVLLEDQQVPVRASGKRAAEDGPVQDERTGV